MNKPLISVVIGSYNRFEFLKAAIKSVRENGMEFPYEIIVVDGGSTDRTLDYLKCQKDIITIIQHNRGVFQNREIVARSWGYFMNLGFKAASGKYIVMISDDSLLVPNAISNGVTKFEKLLENGEKIGAMAFYWRNWPEEQEYLVGLTLGMKMFVNHGMYLRAAVEEVGWIDDDSYHFYHADGDLCLKLWHAGYQVIDCNTSFVEHCNHIKPSKIPSDKDWDAYLTKWEGIFYDPQEDLGGGWMHYSFVDPFQTYKLFPLHMRFHFWKTREWPVIVSNMKHKIKQYVSFKT